MTGFPAYCWAVLTDTLLRWPDSTVRADECRKCRHAVFRRTGLFKRRIVAVCRLCKCPVLRVKRWDAADILRQPTIEGRDAAARRLSRAHRKTRTPGEQCPAGRW